MPTSSPTAAPTITCTALDPNPDGFEVGETTWPNNPWSSSNEDGSWELSEEKSSGGLVSLMSPDLETNGPAAQRLQSSVFLRLCEDFAGGTLRTEVYASVQAPRDIFLIKVDGNVEASFFTVNNIWSWVNITLTPGPHTIEYEYVYNVAGIPPGGLPPVNPEREGKFTIF